MYDIEMEGRVDREIAAFLEEEHAAKGDALYGWYRHRFLAANNKYLTSTIGLAPYDKAIARFVVEHCSFAKRFVEVGAGLAQESMLLAMQGMATYAIETNLANFDMLTRLRARLAQRLDPDLPKRMTPINDFFPRRASEYVDADTILTFPTLSWTIDATQERAIFDSLRAAGGVILSAQDFFRNRPELAEQEELIRQIRSRGFDAPVEVHSWTEWHMGFRPDRIVFMKRSAS